MSAMLHRPSQHQTEWSRKLSLVVEHQAVGAIVMGAACRGLGIVRSLGHRGIPVWVLHEDGHLLATTSRYAQRSLPWVSGDDADRVGFLLDLAQKNGLEGWVLIPTGDEGAALVARHHSELAKRFRLTTPPWHILRWRSEEHTSELQSRGHLVCRL